MAAPSNTEIVVRGTRAGAAALMLTHAAAFGVLYSLLVFIGWAFHDHYTAIGYVLTPRFLAVHHLSQFVSACTVLVLAVVGLDLFILYQMTRKRPRLASAYSHSMLMLLGFLAFVALAGMIHPMAWGRPNAPLPRVNAGIEPVAPELHSSVAVRSP